MLAVLVQVTLMHFVVVREAEPSVVLVAVVWFATRSDIRRAATFGLAAGLCEDLLSTGTGAAWTISTTLVAMISGMLSRGFFADSLPLVSLVTAIATLLRALFFWVVMGFEGYPPGLASRHFHQALWEALFNAAIMIVVMIAARRYEEA